MLISFLFPSHTKCVDFVTANDFELELSMQHILSHLPHFNEVMSARGGEGVGMQSSVNIMNG